MCPVDTEIYLVISIVEWYNYIGYVVKYTVCCIIQEDIVMNKKILLTGAICIAITALAGCGEKKDNELYNSLEKQVKHNASYIEKEQLEANLNLQSAINGSEKEFVVKLVSNANVMNKPSNDASIVGSVKSRESVLIIGNESIDGWYKVAYNGRVCYIEGAKLDRNMLVADNGNDNDGDNSNVNNGDNSRPTSTTSPKRPVSTSGTSNSSTNTSSRGEEDDDETTTRGEGTSGMEDDITSGEEDTTIGGEGTTEDNSGSEGTTPEETTSSDGDVEDTTSGEEDTSSQESSSSEQDTTHEEETTSPVESIEPSTEQSTAEDEHPSTEEQTTPQETEIVPFSYDEEAE